MAEKKNNTQSEGKTVKKSSPVKKEANTDLNTVEPVIPEAISAEPTVTVSAATAGGYRQMNTTALLSFIFAFLFFIPLNSIVSIILGHVGLSQLKRNPNQDGEWAAKAGLIISYIILGATIFGLLILLFLIVLGAAASSML